MISFIGDFECKVDAKNRVAFPAAFKKQMGESLQEGFVLKRDIYDKCLILYPMMEWERQNKLIRSKTNPFNREHSRFLRMFFSGTADVKPDSNNRILLPAKLMEYANIREDVVMAGQYGKIELWSPGDYENFTRADDEFAVMAESILGGSLNLNDEE